jgi:hypothetical protein
MYALLLASDINQETEKACDFSQAFCDVEAAGGEPAPFSLPPFFSLTATTTGTYGIGTFPSQTP